MTTYFYNDKESTTVDGMNLKTLADGDVITFGAQAVWDSLTGAALAIRSSNRVTVNGQLYGLDGIAVLGVGSVITIGQSGIVSGNAYGVNAHPDDPDIYNYGFISGDIAIDVDRSRRIFNTGTIAGVSYAIKDSLGNNLTLTNSGTISGFTSVYLSGSDHAFTLTNSGSLFASNYAIYASGQVNSGGTVNNSGMIDGAIFLGSAAGSSIFNSGTISGDITFAAGDDTIESSTGYLLGRVYGGGGDDVLTGSLASDTLFGGDDTDDLRGGAGDDSLAGGAGADILNGGDGFDLARYSDAAAGVIVDLVSHDLDTGDAEGDSFTSIEGVLGSGFDDRLYGDSGANRLNGSGGDDLLNGRGGDDILRGGLGDDRYFVDSTHDHVIEKAAQGIDTVTSTASRFTLSANVENLVLAGTGAIDGTGNASDNFLTGNNSANTLAGKAGNDSLHGGGGADAFLFDTALNVGTNVDTIDDFKAGTDTLRLSRSIFTELNGGAALQAARFFEGAAAHDASDRIIYDSTTGNLYYDADGTGAIAQIQFARIDPGLALTAADITLVG